MKSVLFAIVLIVAACIITAVIGTVWLILLTLPTLWYTQIRRLGYSPIVSAMLVLGVLLLAVLATIGSAVLVPRPDDLRGTLEIILLSIGMPAVISAVGCRILIRTLPRRQLRVSGRRRVRFPFVSLGYLVMAGALPAIVAMVMTAPPENRTFGNYASLLGVVGAIIVVGRMLLAVGRRVENQASIEALARVDSRSPVLFLRPFVAERLPFVRGFNSQYGRYASQTVQGLARLRSLSDAEGNKQDEDPTISIPFEVYLGPLFYERIGPMIALGNPEDYLPPEGAIRTYAEDEGWYEYFERLARQCVCIVMPVGSSDNLTRELEFLRREGLQCRLFMFTPPFVTEDGRSGWFLRVSNWIRSRWFGLSTDSARPAMWSQMAESLGLLGFDSGADPGRGAVVTFDSEGKALVLVTGADTPSEFVEPLYEHLAQTLGFHAAEVAAIEVDTMHDAPGSKQRKRNRLVTAAVVNVRNFFLMYEPPSFLAWIPYGACWFVAAAMLGMPLQWIDKEPDTQWLAAIGRNVTSVDTYAVLQAMLILFLPVRLWGAWERSRELARREPRDVQQGGSPWGAMLAAFYRIVGLVALVTAASAAVEHRGTALRVAFLGSLIFLCAIPASKWEQPAAASTQKTSGKFFQTILTAAPAIILCMVAAFDIGGMVRDEFRSDLPGYWRSWLTQPALPIMLVVGAALPIAAAHRPTTNGRLHWFVSAAFILLVIGLFPALPSLHDVVIAGGASFRMAQVSFEAQRYAEALPHFERAAMAGNAEAMVTLGSMYDGGLGTALDYQRARYWYQKAATHGEPRAMTNLGLLYANGQGGDQDFARAREWYARAVEGGERAASNNLGVLYATGQGVAQDYVRARELYEQAAAAGNATAMVNLGDLYAGGYGVAQDSERARQWYEQAAAAGASTAKEKLLSLRR